MMAIKWINSQCNVYNVDSPIIRLALMCTIILMIPILSTFNLSTIIQLDNCIKYTIHIGIQKLLYPATQGKKFMGDYASITVTPQEAAINVPLLILICGTLVLNVIRQAMDTWYLRFMMVLILRIVNVFNVISYVMYAKFQVISVF